MNQFKLDEETIQEITHQHDRIIEAIKKKDSQLAFEQMKNHVLAVHNMHKALDSEEK